MWISRHRMMKHRELIDPAILLYLVLRVIGLALPEHSRARYNYIFKYIHYYKHIKTVLDTALNRNSVLFAVVHLNAPDFLLLALESIRRLYPEKPLIVLDNGSHHFVLMKVRRMCKKYRCKLLYNASVYRDHVLAIQYLIDYSSRLGKEFLVILDNDVTLVSCIDDVLALMRREKFVLAGPHDLIKLDEKYFRFAPLAVHASMLILRPKEIIELAGRYCTFNYIIAKYSRTPEPYHSLAYACLGRILYLKPVMLKELFPLTAYTFNNRVIAYHAWYSSRVRIHKDRLIDSLSTEFLKRRHEQIKEFLIDKLKIMQSDLPRKHIMEYRRHQGFQT